MGKSLNLKSALSNLKPLIALSIIWALGIFFICPLGDFPLNDDWVYGLATKHFYEKNEFYPIPWSATALFSNVIWGWGFVKLLGFSFDILRLSSIVASLLGSWGVYYLLFNISKSTIISFIGALALLCNPIFFGLSYTFMTDVFCLTVIIFSLIFFIESFKKTSNTLHLFAATFFSIIATLSRQTSLIIPLAYFLAFLILSNKKMSYKTFIASFPFLISLFSFILLEYGLKIQGHLPAMSVGGLRDFFNFFLSPLAVIYHLPRRLVPMLYYIGLFSLPILTLLQWKKFNLNKKYFGMIFVTLALFNGMRLMPTASNVISNYGMGPITIRDVYFLGINKPNSISNFFWFFISILSLIAASLITYLIPEIIERVRRSDLIKKKIAVFLLLIFLGYFTFFLIFPFFDRYLLIFIPTLWSVLYLIFLDKKIPFKKLLISFSMIIGFLFYSTVTTKDYFNFNKARWILLNHSVNEEKINIKDIDGGYEFNGLYNYDQSLNPSAWWVINDKYLISLGPVNGYHKYKEIEYLHILPKYKQTIYLLEKDSNYP